jgi:hypothetical protein
MLRDALTDLQEDGMRAGALLPVRRRGLAYAFTLGACLRPIYVVS